MSKRVIFTFSIVAILSTLITLGNACSRTTASNDSGGGSNTPTGNGGSASPTVSTKSNQTIASHPHGIDMYYSSNADMAIIFLHGGGGAKESTAYNLGIKKDSSTTSYELADGADAWLKNNKVAMIFPQGQTLSGYSAWTWNNYVMNSGQDDISFLQDLVMAIKNDSNFAGVKKIFLAGHSNGGMMANRMWCESPGTFDGYAALAGPPSLHLDPTLSASATNHPCAPSVVKPYLSIVGDHDTVLATSGKMANKYWTLNPLVHIGNPPTFVDSTPMLMNDVVFYQTRTMLMCATSPAAAVVSGQLTTYEDCNGRLKQILVSQITSGGSPVGGDHCLTTADFTCTTNLKGNSGMDYKTELFNFFSKQ